MEKTIKKGRPGWACPLTTKTYFHVNAQLISLLPSSGVAALGRKTPNQYDPGQPCHDSLADRAIRRSSASGETTASESSASTELGFLCSVHSSPAKQRLGGASYAHPHRMGGMETASCWLDPSIPSQPHQSPLDWQLQVVPVGTSG